MYLYEDFDRVLGISLISNKKEKKISEELERFILEKIEERKNAKEEKNYSLADEIREELLKKGILLKDTREGTTYEIDLSVFTK